MIKVKTDTRELLGKLKLAKRESYDEVINRILLQLIAEEHLEFSESLTKELKERLLEVQKGNVVSSDDIMMLMKKRGATGNKISGKKEGDFSPTSNDDLAD